MVSHAFILFVSIHISAGDGCSVLNIESSSTEILLICSAISNAHTEWNVIVLHPYGAEQQFSQYNAVNWKSASLKPTFSMWKQIIP